MRKEVQASTTNLCVGIILPSQQAFYPSELFTKSGRRKVSLLTNDANVITVQSIYGRNV